jgi:hypothetical protein
MEQRSTLNTDSIVQGPIVSDLRSSAATVKAGKSPKVANADAARAKLRPLPECVVLAKLPLPHAKGDAILNGLSCDEAFNVSPELRHVFGGCRCRVTVHRLINNRLG